MQNEFVTADGVYDKTNKVLQFRSYGEYPPAIKVTSSATGRVIEFEQDTQAAIVNEFWDGELCEYKEITPDTGVRVILW